MDEVPEGTRWKEIPNFPGYWISEHGHVFSFKKMGLKSILSGHGNGPYTYLIKGGHQYKLTIKRLLKEVWGKDA